MCEYKIDLRSSSAINSYDLAFEPTFVQITQIFEKLEVMGTYLRKQLAITNFQLRRS